MSHTFTVTAKRTRGWWALESDNGAFSQVRRLSQAEDDMREAIAFLADIPEAEVEIRMDVRLPADFQRQREAAKRLRREAEQANRQAAEASREAARLLKEDGLSVREIGELMEISYQRAHQLISH